MACSGNARIRGAAVLFGAVLLGVAGGGGGCMWAGKSVALGVREGRLGPLPSSPNAVSSQAQDPERRVEPLGFSGDPQAAWARLRRVLEAMPRTEIVRADERYLHATFTSRIFRFVDDVELLLDPEAGVVHVRSASRVGYSDLGANRARVEALREAFAAAQAGAGRGAPGEGPMEPGRDGRGGRGHGGGAGAAR